MEAVENTLTIFDPEHMSRYNDIATKLRDRIQVKLGRPPTRLTCSKTAHTKHLFYFVNKLIPPPPHKTTLKNLPHHPTQKHTTPCAGE